MIINVYDDHIISNDEHILIDKLNIIITKSTKSFIILNACNSKTNDVFITINKDINVLLITKDINSNIHIHINNNAKLTYQSILQSNKNINKSITISANSLFMYQSISIYGLNEKLDVTLKDTYSEASIKYLSLNDNTLSNVLINVNHLSKYTTSNVVNNIVCIKDSKVNFDVVGFIENKNSNSKCSQLTKGVILDDNSTISSTPSLLINEYDVSAYHGASIGKISDDVLFYLMSRGLSRNEAFKLVISGLIIPFIDSITIEDLKEEVTNKINELI